MGRLSRCSVLSLVALCAPRAAIAEPADESQGITTTVDPCVPVDAEQFQRVLALELGTSIEYQASGEGPAPGVTWVHLRCTQAGIELRLEDAVTRKSMARVLDISKLEAGSRTRLLALAVAEFVVASWVELRVVEEPAVPPAGPRPPESARRLAQRVVRKHAPLPEPSAAPRAPAEAWALMGLFRAEDFSSFAGVVPGASLRVGRVPRGSFAFQLGVDLGFGRTEARLGARDLGDVDLTLASAIGVIAFVTHARDLDLYAGGGGRFGFVSLSGQARAAAVTGAGFTAPYGGPFILARLSYHATHTLALVVEGEGGLVTLPIVGAAGPTHVFELDGAWLALGIGLGVEL